MQDHLTRGTDVALFIDWENFKISLAVGHRTPNVSALKEEVSNFGRVVIAKAYADWVTLTGWIVANDQIGVDPAVEMNSILWITRLTGPGVPIPARPSSS